MDKNNTEHNPFTEQEQSIMDKLIDAHNEFVKMERTHSSEMIEWVTSLHHLQDLLSSRILRRKYPSIFN